MVFDSLDRPFLHAAAVRAAGSPGRRQLHRILRSSPLASVILGCLLLLPGDALGLRIASYNLLNYSSGREAHFRVVLGHIDADVLFVQEILSQSAVDQFRTQVLEVLDPGEWAAGTFVNGPDTDSCFFYRPARVAYLGHHVIPTALRNIDEYRFRPVGYTDPANDVRAYVVHLKASDGSTEQQQRLAEVTLMRNRMETFSPGQNYFIAGDFNIYRSSEPAYTYMLSTSPGLAGVVQDPISAPGDWHNNASFASIHTQSPRTTQFGGGANGGLDDRFDMILVSPSSMDGEGWDILVPTYEAVGQDGLHFNKAIIDAPPNTAVPPEVAQAIHDASDHLPLMAEFQLPPLVETAPLLALGAAFVGATTEELLPVGNRAVAPADELDYSFTAGLGFLAPAGTFTAEAEESPNHHPIGLDTTLPGFYAGAVTIVSDDPDSSSYLVPTTGVVLRHAEPSLAEDQPVVEGELDFGTQAPGSFPGQDAVVYNLGYDALQGLLEVYEAEFAGDPRFQLAAPFQPRSVGSDAEAWTVVFDGTGAAPGLYAATLTFHTRDQQDVPGALERSGLVWSLAARVDDAAGVFTETTPGITAFRRVEPNPFGGETAVVFSLAEVGPVSLAVHDASGRIVATLVSGVLAAGEHQRLWDGRDRFGREVSSGVYFLRLGTEQGARTSRVVKVR